MKVEYDPDNALRRIDTRGINPLPASDQTQILEWFEDPNTTTVVQGLHENLDERFMKWSYIKNKCGPLLCRNFKYFKRKLTLDHPTHTANVVATNSSLDTFEEAGTMVMSFETYDLYLQQRKLALYHLMTTKEQQEQVHHGSFTDSELQELKELKKQTQPEDPEDPEEPAEERKEGNETQDDEITVSYYPSGQSNKSQPHVINLLDDVIYLIDLDITRFIPEAAADLRAHFKMDLLPAGDWCMMNSVGSEGRPFLGPNLYITPPGASTVFHEDGNGTVDSGHQVLTGHNEVVMLPRIDSADKQEALDIVTGNHQQIENYALKVEPHSDHVTNKPLWPTLQQLDQVQEYLSHLSTSGVIEEQEQKNKASKKKGKKRKRGMPNEKIVVATTDGSTKHQLRPTHVILGPGDYIHINKGRLHAFRKVTSDANHALQQKQNAGIGMSTSIDICVSVAWDWMYKGK